MKLDGVIEEVRVRENRIKEFTVSAKDLRLEPGGIIAGGQRFELTSTWFARLCDRLGSLDRAALRAADQAGERESRQRIGQPPGLLPAFLGQFGIGSFAGLGPVRQRVPD